MPETAPPTVPLEIDRETLFALRRLLSAPDRTRLTHAQMGAAVRLRRTLDSLEAQLMRLAHTEMERDYGPVRLLRAGNGRRIVHDLRTGTVHADTPFAENPAPPDARTVLSWLDSGAAE